MSDSFQILTNQSSLAPYIAVELNQSVTEQQQRKIRNWVENFRHR